MNGGDGKWDACLCDEYFSPLSDQKPARQLTVFQARTTPHKWDQNHNTSKRSFHILPGYVNYDSEVTFGFGFGRARPSSCFSLPIPNPHALFGMAILS